MPGKLFLTINTCEKITLVEDNLPAHKPSAYYEVYESKKAKAYLHTTEFIFTSATGSWLNMAEIELYVRKRIALTGT